jgi:hypothetical protein
MAKCIRFRRTAAGMRCAEFRGGFGNLGKAAGGVSRIIAPVAGGTVAVTTAGLLKAFAKPASWWNRNAGFVAMGTSFLASVVIGLLRGFGPGAASTATGLAVGGAVQIAQAATKHQVNKAIEAAEVPKETPEAEGEGMGAIRMRTLGGYGGPRGFLPSVGTSPVDAMNMGVASVNI